MNREEHLKLLKEAFDKMYNIAVSKNSDYCGNDVNSDPFKNFKLVEQLDIISAEKGILIRMCDKMARISSLLNSNDPKVKDESIEDTLLDLANYSVILRNYLLSKK